PGEGDVFLDTVVELERLGYSTIWLTGGQIESLDQVMAAVDATRTARIATGILSVDRFDADTVSSLFSDVEASHPGRLVVGLGGAHGQKPFDTLTNYLDRLDAVPAASRVLA